MTDFPAVLSVANLDGTNGFRMDGERAEDVSGCSVSSAGDINGDGYDDLIIGARGMDTNGGASGGSFIVFGKASGFSATLALSGLDGTNGFEIDGRVGGELSGHAVASAGDINGDGYGDVIIGAPGGGPRGTGPGASFVLFGAGSGFDAVMNLRDLDGTNGFQIAARPEEDENGYSVASAGDVNGDGYGDVIVGTKSANVSYVVFGQASGIPAQLKVADLDGTNGFRMTGLGGAEGFGQAVASAGDVNGDGYDDLIIAAPYGGLPYESFHGLTHVVFGKGSGFTATLSMTSLDGTNGFRLRGERAMDGWRTSVASAGDVNGDGYDDLIIGMGFAAEDAGASYVVFGKASGFVTQLNLSNLDGNNGFRMTAGTEDWVGFDVASAGDLNGDGYDDLVVGAPPYGTSSPGYAFVVFGRGSGFAANLDLYSLDGNNGFRVDGRAAGNRLGFSVASAGDVNGDGYDDLVLGQPSVSPNGVRSGSSYVVFGRASGPVRTSGAAGADAIVGGSGIDSLLGLAGQDVLSGMAGADILDGGDNADVLHGGDGADELFGGQGGDVLNGDAGDDVLTGGDQGDKLYGGDGLDALTGGDGNDILNGGPGLDSLVGGTGADTLYGGDDAVADSLTGGEGNDIYVIDHAADLIFELADEGVDIIRAASDIDALADNIEALQLQGSADLDGAGNALANNIQGNSGTNRLNGAGGVDTINGEDGDDIIVGGPGNDLLRGGTGADTFLVTHAFGAVLETDQVYDFHAGEGDRLDLSGIDAIAGAGDDAFTYAGASFTRHAGEMTLTFAGGITTLRLDRDGDGRVDYQMKINGDVTNDWADWAL